MWISSGVLLYSLYFVYMNIQQGCQIFFATCKHVTHKNKQAAQWIISSATQSYKHGWRPGWRYYLGFVHRIILKVGRRDECWRRTRIQPSYLNSAEVINHSSFLAYFPTMSDQSTFKRNYITIPQYTFLIKAKKISWSTTILMISWSQQSEMMWFRLLQCEEFLFILKLKTYIEKWDQL